LREQLTALYLLQQIDTRLEQARKELDALDSGERLRDEFGSRSSELEEARQRVRRMEEDLLDAELDMSGMEGKRRDYEQKLYGGLVRNAKELQDMQEEVGMLTRSIDALETKALTLMDELEKQRAALKDLEKTTSECEARLRQVEGQYKREKERLESELAELEQRRQAGLEGIPADLLRKYEDLRARKSNLALAVVSGNICPACRVTLPTDTLRDLQAGNRLLFCESCGRMLLAESPSEPSSS
jgi:hypothetical protein